MNGEMKLQMKAKKNRQISLNKRIMIIPIAALLPMLCMSLYLLSVLIQFSDEYNEITKSVTYANNYSREFKERMDYSMYLSIIGNKTVDELGNGETTINGIKTVNPYTYCEELSEVCDELSDMATASINRTQIKFVKNSLKSLVKAVGTLEQMIDEGATYTDKIEFLEINIRGQSGLTTVIQGALQNYVYEETKNYDIARKNLEQEIRSAIEACLIATGVAIVLSLILSGITVNSVTKPIKRLCSQTKKIARGDFTTKARIESVDEIAVLTDSFNDMTEEIGRLIENIKKQEENLRMTESRLLQAQINPHFLYNTLDTIVWLAEEKKTPEVVAMVTALSSFFRTTLSKGKDYITIQEEESHIRSYLEIQKFRYQDIMNYEIDIPAELYQYYIPKLTLQPLVENALYHGIKNKRGGGVIRITGWMEQNHILFRVSDNGIGMSAEDLEKLRRSLRGISGEIDPSGFGLVNVNQRLKHYYGEQYGVFFDSQEKEGTEATVVIAAKNCELKNIQPIS